MDRSELLETLQGSELFEGLEPGLVERIADLCSVQNYGPGEKIFCQGDVGEHLYIILDGHVYLDRSVDLGARRGNVLIGVLGKGRIFGCWSTLLDRPHSLLSSAVCKGPTTVAVIRGVDLRELMTGDRDMGFCILQRLCFLLRDRIQGVLGAMEKI